MKFTKMHGIGNDYVYVDGFAQDVADPPAVARRVTDRHFGIGGDGLILILPSDRADVRMRMFNADGSEAEMCGNGIRCVAKYAFDHGLAKANPMRVETGNGVLALTLETTNGTVERVTVNMGAPILEAAEVPVRLPGLDGSSRVVDVPLPEIDWGDVGAAWIDDAGLDSRMTCVSMGNPHVVLYCEDAATVPLDKVGPILEHHEAFPRRINVHFVQVRDRGEVVMRTWERGSGITLACGTGASAVCVAGVLSGRTDRQVLAHLPGGDLRLEWRESDNCVYMTGPATEVFSGDWPD
jgi:diaminopimelate epimerase